MKFTKLGGVSFVPLVPDFLIFKEERDNIFAVPQFLGYSLQQEFTSNLQQDQEGRN